jgi:hypothetical protein
MAGVDLNVYRFDYDLTFAALLMNADGTIYHVYGGRDWRDAQSHLSMAAFVSVLRDTLPEHAAYQERPRPPRRRAARTIEEIPPMAERIRTGKAPDCFHCHMVHDSEREHAQDQRRWKRSDIWIWPDPAQAGLSLDRDDQAVITAVATESPAARAGLEVGDRLLTLDDMRILTFGDVQRVLDALRGGPTSVPVTWSRDGDEQRGSLRLPARWKEATPLVFSWRPSKWGLSPRPGFGGRALTPEEREAAGVEGDGFAFRVQYLVTWGAKAHTGRNAQRAGIRKNDVVLSVAGKDDFRSVAHFHAWFRLTRKAGETVDVVLLRQGDRKTIRLPVVD